MRTRGASVIGVVRPAAGHAQPGLGCVQISESLCIELVTSTGMLSNAIYLIDSFDTYYKGPVQRCSAVDGLIALDHAVPPACMLCGGPNCMLAAAPFHSHKHCKDEDVYCQHSIDIISSAPQSVRIPSTLVFKPAA